MSSHGSRIGQTSRGASCRCRKLRQRNLSGARYVKDCLAGGQQIIRDYSSMAPPPNRFGAHNGAALLSTQLSKPSQTFVKGVSQGVVGIVMKALILPKRVNAG